MTVKRLIEKLLEMPMDAEIKIALIDKESADYSYGNAEFVVDYEDNTVGIIESCR